MVVRGWPGGYGDTTCLCERNGIHVDTKTYALTLHMHIGSIGRYFSGASFII